jgi:hypothetical protein
VGFGLVAVADDSDREHIAVADKVVADKVVVDFHSSSSS